MAGGRSLGVLLCLSLAVWWSPGDAEETNLLPDPSSADLADLTDIGWGSLGITNCTNGEIITGKANIVCYFVLTQTKYDQRDYSVKKLIRWKPRLIDNLGIEHEFVTLYIIDRRGQQPESVNLAKGESAWFAAEFSDGGHKDITGARVIFSNLSRDPELRASVTPIE